MDTLILANDNDIKNLEQLSFQLVNLLAVCKRTEDNELMIERNVVINKILKLCSKYRKHSGIGMQQVDVIEEVLYIHNFLSDMAHSEEWDAKNIKKRAEEIEFFYVA